MGLESFAQKAKMNAKYIDALGTVDSVLSAFSTVSSVYNLSLQVLDFLGLSDPAPDPFSELLSAIQKDMKEIYGSVMLASQHEDDRSLDEITSWSKTTAIQATKYIKAERKPENPAFVVASALDNSSLQTMVALSDVESSYWQQLFNSHKDDPRIKIPDTDYVWDYRLTLPYYLQAISSRLIVIEAIEPEYRNNRRYADELKGYVSALESIYKKIESCLIIEYVTSQLPDFPKNMSLEDVYKQDAAYHFEVFGSPFWKVISLHTALYYEDKPLFKDSDMRRSWGEHITRKQKAAEEAYQKLCKDVGLFKLKHIIRLLNHLANSSSLNGLQDIVAEFGTVKLLFAINNQGDIIPSPRADDGSISLKYLASITNVASPISFREILRKRISLPSP